MRGVTPPGEGQKIGEKGGFAAPKAPRKILEHFLEIFGKFVNENAKKSGSGGGLGRNISEIS